MPTKKNKTKRPGGLAVARKVPPEVCPDCGKEGFKNWMAWLGHRSVHKFAQNRHMTYKEGARYFYLRYQARSDAQMSWDNGANSRNEVYLRLKVRAQALGYDK